MFLVRKVWQLGQVMERCLFLYDATSPAGSSDQLGIVNLVDGTVTNVGNIGYDTDALSFRADGTLFGEDVTLSATSAESRIYSVNATSGAPTLLGSNFQTAYNLNDMTFGLNGVLHHE